MIFTNSPKNDDLSDVSLTMQYGNITSGEKKISYDYDQLGCIKNIIRSAGLNNTGQLSYEYDIHSWTKRISSNTFEEAGYDENGNIESLHRNGLQKTRKYGAIDDLQMIYDGNKLSSIVESAL